MTQNFSFSKSNPSNDADILVHPHGALHDLEGWVSGTASKLHRWPIAGTQCCAETPSVRSYTRPAASPPGSGPSYLLNLSSSSTKGGVRSVKTQRADRTSRFGLRGVTSREESQGPRSSLPMKTAPRVTGGLCHLT